MLVESRTDQRDGDRAATDLVNPYILSAVRGSGVRTQREVFSSGKAGRQHDICWSHVPTGSAGMA